jgi:hypothetical protein
MSIFVSSLSSTSSAYRDGNILVVPSGTNLPPICVKCGAPVARVLTKTFRWHSPWLYLLILPGLIFYVVVALVAQRKARNDVPFCQTHLLWRTRMNIAGAVLLIGVLPTAFLLDLGGIDGGIVALIAVVMVLSGLVILGIVGSSFTPVFIDESCAKFKGAGEQFLSALSTTMDAPAPHGVERV